MNLSHAARFVFLLPIWFCFIIANEIDLSNVLTSYRSDLKNGVDLIMKSRIGFPFSDEDMGNGYNGRSPALARLLKKGDGLWETGTVGIIGTVRGIVKARRRQGWLDYSFCVVSNDALPRNANGKIDKPRLRQIATRE